MSMTAISVPTMTRLDVTRRSPHGERVEEGLREKVIGQDRAIRALVGAYERARAKALGLSDQNRPIGSMLILGPTGSGKTHTIERFADIIHGDPMLMIKIDCAEYQHSHEISKLTGAPPSYLGHRETPPLLSQKRIDGNKTVAEPISIILFDEIEKAHDSFFQLMLGVLDKAVLTLGDNSVVDFSECFIIMTSNLGSREISDLSKTRMGFTDTEPSGIDDQDIYRTALGAAKKHFTPEFMNRIDKTVVFRNLTPESLLSILRLEVEIVAHRFRRMGLNFCLTAPAERLLLEEGQESRYGARHIKRAIDRLLTAGLTSLVLSGQSALYTDLIVDADSDGKLAFLVPENRVQLV